MTSNFKSPIFQPYICPDLKKSSPIPRFVKTFYCGCYRKFIFKPVKFIYTTHLTLYFVYGENRGQHSFFFTYAYLIKYYLLVIFFLNTLPWHFWHKLSNWICMSLCMKPFLFHWFIYLSFCQYHTVLFTVAFDIW